MTEREASATSTATGPSPEAAARIRSAVTRDLQPVRARTASGRLALAVLAAFAALALAGVSFGMKLGAPVDHPTEVGIALCALAAGAIMAVRGTPGSARSQSETIGAPLVAVSVWIAYLVWLSTAPGGPAVPAASCLAVSSLAGVVALAAATWVWRNTDPWTPRATGARLGGLAGLAGAAGIGIACTHHELKHLLVGHGLAIAILVALGALVGARALRP